MVLKLKSTEAVKHTISFQHALEAFKMVVVVVVVGAHPRRGGVAQQRAGGKTHSVLRSLCLTNPTCMFPRVSIIGSYILLHVCRRNTGSERRVLLASVGGVYI